METTQTLQTNFTDEENQLAERYGVEAKLIRMISEIVSEHTEGINQLISLMQGRKEQAEPEVVEEERGIGPGTTVEKMVEDWFKKQSYSTKLAVCIFSDYICGDHDPGDITHRIEHEYRAEIIAMAKNPADSLSKEEIVMSGICCELAVWSKNL